MCHWLNVICVTHPRWHTISSKLEWSRYEGATPLKWASTCPQTAWFYCLRTAFTPDVFYTSEILGRVVSSHSRNCLPFADICFDTQPLLSPDILLKMLEPGILFHSQFESIAFWSQFGREQSWPSSPRAFSETPVILHGRLTACCTSQTQPVTFDIYLRPWCGIFHPDPDSLARSLTSVFSI